MPHAAPSIPSDPPFSGDRGPAWWGLAELRHAADTAGVRRVAGLWLLAVLASCLTAAANVVYDWNALRLSLFGLPVDVTLYPPFLLSVLLVLWIGPTWGALAIYLANLTSALVSGMGPAMSALFAVAGVIETLILWGSLVLLRVDPDLRRARDWAWFTGAGLVAAVTGSLAAILWNATHGLDPGEGQRLWRGWVVGDLAQILLLAPLLFLCGRPVRAWLDRQLTSTPRRDFSYVHGVGLIVSSFAVLGLVVFLGVHQSLASIEAALASSGGSPALLPRLREIVLVMGLLSTALIVATGMFSTALARMGERERREAQLDSLTGCHNRRAFPLVQAREAERSRRLGVGLGYLFLDLDRFKSVNDQYGHAAGDRMLVEVARRVEGAVRQTDVVFRWGGEEFLVLLPHTQRDELGTVAERVRAAVADLGPGSTPGTDDLHLTASVGTAWSDRFPLDGGALVATADAACYRAKARGGDCVEAGSSPPLPSAPASASRRE